RLYRPFPAAELVAAIPGSVRSVAVLDRTKEPGSEGEPLYLDVVSALAEAVADGARPTMPRVVGGRYGLSSKEFTPGMVAGVFSALAQGNPPRPFTRGITDDVSGTSITYDAGLDIEDTDTVRAVFYGIGSDGTVGANKNTIKILGQDRYAQAYFVYDSKKSGGTTISHLRFGPHPIAAPYLVTAAQFVGVHHEGLLDTLDVMAVAEPGAVVLLNTTTPSEHVWASLSRSVQAAIVDKGLRLFAINADKVAADAGLPGRTNTVLQTCFFAISGVLPRDEAIERIKAAIRSTYARRGPDIIARNEAAVDAAVAHLSEIDVTAGAQSARDGAPLIPDHAPQFVREVTAAMMGGRGDDLPVSALPADGTYPSGTTAYE